jgi:ELWxxDGT repeat protein
METNLGQVVLVKDINPETSNYGFTSGSSPFNLTEFNDRLYFSASDGENGRELWVSDGTTDGTQLLKDINPGGSDSGFTYNFLGDFTELNDRLYFGANDGENGNELWVSDGTAEGTQLLVDIDPGASSSYPSDFTELNDRLYFGANDGENGRELWVSDGTAEGTQLLKDINPGESSYGYAK